jgi:hypothetical protein
MSTPTLARGSARRVRPLGLWPARFAATALLSLVAARFMAAQSATPFPAVEATAGGWRWMFEGSVYAEYDRQRGDRGGSQVGSINWGMLMGTHGIGAGQLQLRTMLSLDVLGVGASGYPLLLQSGESYAGRPIHDRQHPHDAIMELGAVYRRPLTRGVDVSVYAAPVGEPALGPVAFMMRPSALDIPVAPIGHHWQDATHVSFGVISAALLIHEWKLEGSWFNGREPDDNRWNIDPIRLDSWSGRLSFSPGPAWSVSASYGYLNSPAATAPSVSEHRGTLSVAHGIRFGTDGQWSTALIWGENAPDGAPMSGSVLAETELSPDALNSFVARAEYVQKSADDLVLDVAPFNLAPDRLFGVSEFSAGYVREVASWGHATLGLGVLGTLNTVPSALRAAYGSTTPVGAMVFLRLRPRRLSAGAMAGMTMDGEAAAPQSQRP